MINATLVSVIIPAFNEEKNISRCLQTLSKQTYKNIEVVLVDDSSIDNTTVVAKRLSKKLKINLNLITLDTHQERGKARNLGAKKARGNYLLFIDADMVLSKEVIEECVDQIQMEPNVGAIIIPEESIGVGFWTKARALEKKCYLEDDYIEAARFFKREAFWEVEGWDDEMISGEDWDLTRRIRGKYKLLRINAKIFHNEGRLTLWKVFKKKFYYASKSKTYLKKYPLKFTDLFFFVFRPAYFRNWKLLLLNPIHALGMLVLKIIEILAGGLGLLYLKLSNPR